MVESDRETTILGGPLKASLLRTAITTLACIAISSVGVVSASPAKAEALEVTDECAEVTVLGLRGSSFAEKRSMTPFNSSSNDPVFTPDPFGTVGTASADVLAAQLPDGVSMKRVTVPFETMNNQVSVPGVPERYREGVTKASKTLSEAISSELRDCTSTKIVIIGFDQGAQVAHETVASLPDTVLSSIGALWLISDPIGSTAEPHQIRLGGDDNNTSSEGMWLASEEFSKFSPPQPAVFPFALDKRIFTVCLSHDFMCATSSTSPTTGVPRYDLYKTPDITLPPAKLIAEIVAKCADVTFMAARGSGEDENAGSPQQPGVGDKKHMKGYGDTIATMAYQVKSNLDKNISTSMEYVEYQALSVDEAMNPLPSRYPQSVSTGIKGGTDFVSPSSRMYQGGVATIKAKMAECPDSKYITMGYSQGSHAMHEIMMHLDRGERDKIKASILIADAIRNIDDGKTLAFFGSGDSLAGKDTVIYQGNGVMRVAAYADQVCFSITQNEKVLSRLFGNFIDTIATKPLAKKCKEYLPSDIRFMDVVSFRTFDEDMNHKILNVCSVDDLVCQIKKPDDLDVASFTYATFDALSGNLPSSCEETASEYINNLCHNAANIDEIHGRVYKTDPAFYTLPGQWGADKIR